jgi:hypothetical protein
VVAQVIDYASWVHDLSAQEIEHLAEVNCGKPLEELFYERFRCELPESLNEEQRLLIVATQLDPQSERIVQFLSEYHGMNINVVFFDYYRNDNQEFVGRSWLIAPEEVKRNVRTRGSSTKRALLTLEELASLADERGVGALYQTLHDSLSRLSDQVGTTQSNVSYRWRTQSGSRVALVSVYPKVSSPDLGLVADIRVDDLAVQFDLGADELRTALPEQLRPRQVDLYLYADGYAFRDRDEIQRFLAKLESGRDVVDRRP